MSDLLDALSRRLDEADALGWRDALPTLSPALRVVVLFLDVDGEVATGGLLAFVQNTTGRYLHETIAIFRAIGAAATAEALARAAPFSARVHFDDDDIAAIARCEQAFVATRDDEDVYGLMRAFVAAHAAELTLVVER